ncbi:cell death abnormality protein 1-like isoform X2 [Mizuhopecten yessoensis]|uniref:cell death abnormality protein 1-like isoform X2 n=1 Tax=Mizuhopecten yessoensis TaxID=6573 RepID=UPI000B45D0F1|nr:cell death abnormality protein 1-like isoform X2 [Mizuhopecten yessoensis]
MGVYRYLLVSWSVITTLTVVNASENIASGKATNQSGVHNNYDSSKAVDGCVRTTMLSNCCTHTATGQTEAWWQVNLQTQSVIDSVNIIYRDENFLSRLAGYEVYLSYTQDWTSGTRCHKDTTADLASVSVIQNVQCPGVARYLTIYNDRRVKAKAWYSDDAILELCEVQVYGCPVGKYGNGNCNNDCMNCVNNMCDATSGTCGDCAAGYHKTGAFCVPCPVNCAVNKCDSLTGACTDGCTAGFSGTLCRCPVNCKDTSCPVEGQCTDCIDGYYGPFCTPCPVGCSPDTCDKTSGHCVQCDIGFYGSFCNQSCPVNCKNNVCYKDNAQCTECFIGFYSSFCDQPCSSYCKNNVCNKDNGQCTGCNDGFYGPSCTPCPSGCSTDTCDKTSGHCVQCDIGFHGSFCNQSCPVNCKNNVCNIDNGQCQECDNGFYGIYCTQPCLINCKNNVCMKDDGQCTECEAGFYGSECNESCPDNCQDALCYRSSGECEVCVAGFHGSQCLKSCGDCQGLSCDKDSGDCATGCTDGWTGDKCDTKVVIVMNEDAAVGIGVGSGVVILALVVVIIVQTRRLAMKRGDTTRSTHMTDITLSRTAKGLNNDQDGNYDEIATHKEQSIAQISHTEGNYEQLERREVDVPHMYDTTNVDTKT